MKESNKVKPRAKEFEFEGVVYVAAKPLRRYSCDGCAFRNCDCVELTARGKLPECIHLGWFFKRHRIFVRKGVPQ